MLVMSSAAAENNTRVVRVHDQPYVLREYIGNAPTRGIYVDGNEANDNALPQGFLVTQPPGSVTPAHFHECDQFQVFVSGSALLGKKCADPLTIQFAGAHTPYGPITAGPNGVQYFTLRKRWDPGAKYMPQMRDRLIRGRQRQRLSASIDCNESATITRHLLAPEADGLLAYIMHLSADEIACVPTATDGDGQYHVVLEGTLVHDNQTLPALSCQFAFANETSVSVTAGSKGAKLLVLRFPKTQSTH